MHLKWNTGRLYQEDGQWIEAKTLDDGQIIFADRSRMVDGCIDEAPYELYDDAMFKRYVMHMYDHNRYKRSAESWEFLMVRQKS